MTRRMTSDTGAAGSLSMVLLVPVFCVLATMGVQAALWGYARSEVRAVARAASSMTARGAVSEPAAESSLRASLASIDGFDAHIVDVQQRNGVAVTRVAGQVPGLVHGLASTIDVTESVPIEGWRPGW